MQLPQLELERLTPSDILKKLRDSLTPREVKFESMIINPEVAEGTVVVRAADEEDDDLAIVDYNPFLAESLVDTRNCPIYFYNPGTDVVVLPPASIGDDKLETLDKLLEKIIAHDANFVSSTVKSKNLVIPIAINSRFGKHFVNLYFNPVEQRITIYDSMPENFWSANYTYFFGLYNLLRNDLHKFDIAQNATLEVKYLNLQQDRNSCGYWTRVLSVAIAEYGEAAAAIANRERLRKEFLDDLKQVAIKQSEEKFLELLEETFDKGILEQMVKKAMAYRQNISFNGEPFREDIDIALDDLIKSLNDGASEIDVNFLKRFLVPEFFQGLPSNLSVSQRVIFDSIFFYLLGDQQIAPLLDMRARGTLDLMLFDSVEQCDEIDAHCSQCSKEIKDNLFRVYCTWLNQKLQENRDLFRGDPNDWANTSSISVSVVDSKQTIKLNPAQRTSTQLAFASFKAAIKIMLIISLIILVALLALFLASNPAVGIGLLVGAGAAGVGYGAYKLFKCCSKPKDEDLPVNKLKNR